MCIVAGKRVDRVFRITDAKTGERIEFPLSESVALPTRGWAIYPLTVLQRLQRNFPGALSGAEIAFASDLPRASGMSSSSALVTAVFTVLSKLNDLERRPEYIAANIADLRDVAGYLGCIENGQNFGPLLGDAGVGTFGGSEDHTAILCCLAEHVSQYSFCPVRHEKDIRLPDDVIWVIAASGVSAAKAGSAKARYNQLSRGVAEILTVWNRSTGNTHATLAEAVRCSGDAPERIRTVLMQSADSEFPRDFLLARLEQFVLESESIIPRASDALEGGEWKSFGELVAESQLGAEQRLGNQVQETIALVRLARELGAIATSAFGAGFGGSVWALVERPAAETFRTAWQQAYTSGFNVSAARSEFFVTQAGPPLLAL